MRSAHVTKHSLGSTGRLSETAHCDQANVYRKAPAARVSLFMGEANHQIYPNLAYCRCILLFQHDTLLPNDWGGHQHALQYCRSWVSPYPQVVSSKCTSWTCILNHHYIQLPTGFNAAHFECLACFEPRGKFRSILGCDLVALVVDRNHQPYSKIPIHPRPKAFI